jgi:hypothetical protein
MAGRAEDRAGLGREGKGKGWDPRVTRALAWPGLALAVHPAQRGQLSILNQAESAYLAPPLRA